MADRDAPRTLRDAAALAAMANPYRSRMLDALSVHGPSTASSLAKRTGQAVGSVSHHLKVLAEAGLIEPAPELARDRRERWWRLVSPRTRWSRTEFADDPAAVSAALAAESLVLERQVERSREWLGNAGTSAEWDAAAFATQFWFSLTPVELRELSEQIVGLLQSWRERNPAEPSPDRESVFVFARGFPAQP